MASASDIERLKNKIATLQKAIANGDHIKLFTEKLTQENAALKQEINEALRKLGRETIADSPVSQVQSATLESEKASNENNNKQMSAKQAAKKAAKDAKKQVSKPKQATTPTADSNIDLSRVKLIIGQITEVSLHPDADGLYLEKMECGEAEPRQVISGLVKHVPIEKMQNRKVIMVANLKPAKMRGITSYGMVLCAKKDDKVELINCPPEAQPGDIVTTEDFLNDSWKDPDSQMNPKKKIFEKVQLDFATDDNFVGMYRNKPFLIKGKEASTKGTFKADTIAGGTIS